VSSGETGEHQERWHNGWKPKTDIGVNMDHNSALSGQSTIVVLVICPVKVVCGMSAMFIPHKVKRWGYANCFVLVSFCCMTSILVQCFSSCLQQKPLSFCSSFSDHKRSDMYLLEGVQIFSEMRQMYSIYFSLWLWSVTSIALFGCCISADTDSGCMLAWEGKHGVIV